MENVSLPSTLTTIGAYAFQQSGVKNLTIPPSVTSIGDYAFAESGLESLTIEAGPNPVVIGSYAFSECISLTTVSIPSNVEEIEELAFSNCTNLSSVMLAEGLKTISFGVFKDCVNLTAITLPESLERIEAQAFAGTGLKEVVVPDGTAIDNQAFMNSALERITLPSTITRIEMDTFSGCKNLEEVDLNGAKVSQIGPDAFNGCESLTSFNFPDIELVEGKAFQGCNLGDLVLETNSENGIVLKENAFLDCGATSITITEDVKGIGAGAFAGSPGARGNLLKWVRFTGTTPPILKDVSAFHTNNFELATIYVPEESLLEYKGSEVWKDLPYKGAGWGDYLKTENGYFNFKHYPFKGDYDKKVDENNVTTYHYVGWNGDYNLNGDSGFYEYAGEGKGAYILRKDTYEYVGDSNGNYDKLPAGEYVEVGIGHGNYRIGKVGNEYKYIEGDYGEGDYIYKEYIYVGDGQGEYNLTAGEYELVGGKGAFKQTSIGNYQSFPDGVPGTSYDEYRKSISIIGVPDDFTPPAAIP